MGEILCVCVCPVTHTHTQTVRPADVPAAGMLGFLLLLIKWLFCLSVKKI